MKIYKFIPLIITILVGAILCLNSIKGSVVYMMLNAGFQYIPMRNRLIAFGLYIILPAIIISVLGASGIDKLKKGEKSLFIIWIFLFLVWVYWILILTRTVPFIDPLSTIL
jgi:hypothetical protein